MPRIEASVEIGRPCVEVFAFVMAPANAPRYDPAVVRYEPLDGHPLTSRVRIVDADHSHNASWQVHADVLGWREKSC